MPLNDIVNVVITRETQTISETGFGVPMILGTSNHFTDLIKFYTSIDEVALDFDPSDEEYIAAQDIFSQTISPAQIAIGRRQVDNVTVAVETAMTGEDYNIIGNGIEVPYTSTSAFNYSIATIDADLETDNRIAVSVNSTGIGTVTSVIDFNQDFVASNSIVATINATPLSPVVYSTSQAVTIAAVASAIAGVGTVASATVTGPRQITVVFNAVGVNTVNSVVTTLGASQPTATIAQGGFVFDTDTATTMQNIADQIEVQFPTFTATVSPAPSHSITVQAPTGQSATFNSFVITGGANQANVVIVNPLQPVTRLTVAAGIVAAVNAAALLNPLYPVTANNNMNGTFTLVNRTPGTAYTLRVSTSIESPNSAQVKITQVEPNAVYTVTLNGVDFTYPSGPNVQSAEQVADALVDMINTIPLQVDVVAINNNNGSFRIESNNSINTFSISVSPEIMSFQKGLIVLPLVAANPVATDLTNINNANSNWYALIATTRDAPTVKAIAAWVETRIKLFGTASSDLAIINVPAGTDTTSIAAFLNQGGYVRTFVMYHQDANDDYPEAAWFGAVLPLDPGSETWAFKTLNSISASNITTTQQNNALNKKANIYTFVAGVNITQNGTVAQGEYIDVVRGIDWLQARIQESVFSVLVQNPKVPYTDSGIAVIQAQVMQVLQQGVNNNFLTADPAPTCTVPRASSVPAIDKTNRILRNVRFQATLAGAIHAVRISGTISV